MTSLLLNQNYVKHLRFTLHIFCFFQFMRKIMQNNTPGEGGSDPSEETSLVIVQLASKFLFSSGLRTKKSLRGPAADWYELLTAHFRGSKRVRAWFCQKVLFDHPSRFCEYILECPTAEVRTAFVRIIVLIAHFSLGTSCSNVIFLYTSYK